MARLVWPDRDVFCKKAEESVRLFVNNQYARVEKDQAYGIEVIDWNCFENIMYAWVETDIRDFWIYKVTHVLGSNEVVVNAYQRTSYVSHRWEVPKSYERVTLIDVVSKHPVSYETTLAIGKDNYKIELKQQENE